MPQDIDRYGAALDIEMPEGPTVARRGPLHVGADLVDRAGRAVANQAAVARPADYFGVQSPRGFLVN